MQDSVSTTSSPWDRSIAAASLRVVGPDGDRLLAGEPGHAWREHGGLISWGVPDPAAAQFVPTVPPTPLPTTAG